MGYKEDRQRLEAALDIQTNQEPFIREADKAIIEMLAEEKAVSHTPGPWHVGKNGQPLDEYGNAVLPAAANLSYKNGAARNANASLIAAAPELLAIVEQFIAGCNRAGIKDYNIKYLAAARAAVKKAKGE